MISIDLNITLLFQLVLLLIIILMGNILYLKPITETMRKREEKINGLIGSAEADIKAVEDSKLAYEEKLKSVKSEIASYHIKSREETSKEIEGIIAKAKSQVAEVTKANRQELALSIESARANLDQEVKVISEMIHKNISGRV